MQRTETIDPSVVAAITDIVSAAMKPYGFTALDVSPTVDHDGDPILSVDVAYENSGSSIDLHAVVPLITKVRSRLVDMGELRFPHIRHHFHDDQDVLPRRSAKRR